MKGIFFILGGIFGVVTQGLCGLHPYYLHFPPPSIYPVFNRIDTDYPPVSTWSQIPLRNSTVSRNGNNFPSGPIPLIVHTWVNPDKSDGAKLQNGTVIYYVGGPWGGIRASTPSTTEVPPKPLQLNGIEISSNSLEISGDDYSPNRAALLQRPPQREDNGNNNNGGYLGWSVPIVDITTPPSRQTASNLWSNAQLGQSTTSTEVNKIPDITTSATPTRTQILQIISSSAATTTTTSRNRSSSPSSAAVSTSAESEPITEDSVAASTNARFPVSPSVRKFRRIVAQIRAIAKKELRNADLTKSPK